MPRARIRNLLVLVMKPGQVVNPGWSGAHPDPAPWRVYNIGNHTPVDLLEVVRLLERALGRPAIRELLPMQPGDVYETCADVEDLRQAVGFAPKTAIADGIGRFIDWFRPWHDKHATASI